jgi:hypothetical protein
MTVSIAVIVELAVRVFEDIRTVRAVFGLGGTQVQSHVGDLRGVGWHTAERPHVWRGAGAVTQRCWPFEAGGIAT